MALGTFDVVIDGNQVGAGTEKGATYQVQFAYGRKFVKDTDAGLLWFPHLSNPDPVPTQLPRTVTLVTDVETGTSEAIGYTITVRTNAGGIVSVGPFPAQAADSTVNLADLTADFEGAVSESIALRAETARDEAEAAAAAAALVGTTNDGVIAGRINDDASVTRAALTRTGTKPVGRGELTFNILDYVADPGSIDDWSPAAASAILDAADAGGGEVFMPAGNYPWDATVPVPSGVTIRGHKGGFTTITLINNAAAFEHDPGTDGTTFKRLGFVGTLPTDTEISTRANEVAIQAFGTWDNPVTDVRVKDCRFDRISGTAIRTKHVDGLRVRKNKMRRCGYAAVGMLSTKNFWVEDNEIVGASQFSTFAPNAYGIYASTLEADGPVGTAQNPRSSDGFMRGNIVRNQLWAGINTHVAQRITISQNQCRNISGNGISAGYIATSGDDALLSPTDTLIVDNVITYSNLTADANVRAGIMLRGSTSSSSARERCTGAVTGNRIKRMGAPETTTSGAIIIGAGEGLVVSGNTISECRCTGINLIDCLGTVISGNTFIDLWRDNGVPVVVRVTMTHETAMDITLTGNKLLRGKLVVGTDVPATVSVNTSIVNGTNSAAIVVNDNGNDWGEGNPTWASAITRQQRLTLNRRMVDGTAAPTTGTWLTGDQIRNTTPTSGGWVGWICTNGGTPGTWRGFGAIAAS